MAGYTKSLDLELSSTQYAESADTASLSIVGDLSVACRVKFETLPGSGVAMVFVGKANDAATSQSYRFGIDNVSGSYYVRLAITDSDGVNGSESYGGPVALSTGVWYSFGATFVTSGTNRVSNYFNGTEQADNFVQDAADTVRDNGDETHIGAFGTVVLFDGIISDVYLWARALTGTEMGNYHTAPCSFAPGANLAAHWSLNDVYTDDSGNGNTLTAVNTPAFATDVPFTCGNANFLMFMP